MRFHVFLAAFAILSNPACAKETFTGQDFSGTYDCKGQDSHEGPYTGVVTLTLVESQSTQRNGAYTFKLEVPGYGAYPGHGISQGRTMAIYFANTDPTTKDFGTGIAFFAKNKPGKWTFTKNYYEPEFKGGNYGSEVCTQR